MRKASHRFHLNLLSLTPATSYITNSTYFVRGRGVLKLNVPLRLCPPGAEPSHFGVVKIFPLSSMSELTRDISKVRSTEWVFIEISKSSVSPGAARLMGVTTNSTEPCESVRARSLLGSVVLLPATEEPAVWVAGLDEAEAQAARAMAKTASTGKINFRDIVLTRPPRWRDGQWPAAVLDR